jgi:hypothetical protein
MGNAAIQKLNFEDMKSVLQNRDKYVIINTLPADEQDCLIAYTTHSRQEEEIINAMLNERKKYPMGPPPMGAKTIVCYGRNANDEKAYKKAEQLVKLGFSRVYFYPAGLFEWMLLQDIYGADEFPTTRLERDIIKFRPPSALF